MTASSSNLLSGSSRVKRGIAEKMRKCALMMDVVNIEREEAAAVWSASTSMKPIAWLSAAGR